MFADADPPSEMSAFHQYEKVTFTILLLILFPTIQWSHPSNMSAFNQSESNFQNFGDCQSFPPSLSEEGEPLHDERINSQSLEDA